MKLKILLITGDFGEDYEVIVPFMLLKAIGYEVHVACPKKREGETVASSIHDINKDYQTVTEWEGHRININVSLEHLNPADYIALVLPGGRSCEYLRTYPIVRDVTSHFIKENKPIASICRGVQILLATGLLKGKTMTGNFVCQTEVQMAGNTYEKLGYEGVVVDGNIVYGVEWHGLWTWMQAFMEKLEVAIDIPPKGGHVKPVPGEGYALKNLK
ncbi:DJ-1/PfpI family protein [Pseudovibrio sp. Ad26]|uniref:DJ-1/PfpI family protein n=1 Tax=Pseudovibrio sp. Ad26 TaxID=989410 RepID=UPI0007AEBC39|nr:DJ-1/PfpI family protein [Pseudovibrio sp. Ad26]KZL12829.1 putative cysteine protease YraA [Pseudovibrio sp. Ad26]